MPGRLGLDRSAHFGIVDSRFSPRNDQLQSQTFVRVPSNKRLNTALSGYS